VDRAYALRKKTATCEHSWSKRDYFGQISSEKYSLVITQRPRRLLRTPDGH